MFSFEFGREVFLYLYFFRRVFEFRVGASVKTIYEKKNYLRFYLRQLCSNKQGSYFLSSKVYYCYLTVKSVSHKSLYLKLGFQRQQ